MILITVGTQDKKFTRLLEAVQNQIDSKIITDKVIVQAGCNTDFKSEDMEIFELISIDDFNKLVAECDILITHGGVGSIIDGLKHNKKIIAAPRLQKFGEAASDHQLQIIDIFSNLGYILPLYDFSKLGNTIKQTYHFKPKKYKSNNQKFTNLVNEEISKHFK